MKSELSITLLLYLPRLTVHTGEQQPSGLPNIVAVHGEAAPMLGVRDRHTDPLHQRGQYQERPARKGGATKRGERLDKYQVTVRHEEGV